MTLRWLIVLAVLGGLGGLLWQLLPEVPAVADAGSQAEPFKLPDLAGELQQLPEGAVILLNFWATWCPPCRHEIPSMITMHEQLAPKGLKIVAVSVDHELSDLQSFVSEYKMPFQVLHDGNSVVAQRYGVFRFPETFLIDRHGVIQKHYIGAVDWASRPVRATIESLLSEPFVAETSSQSLATN